jgi:hypothetical protein
MATALREEIANRLQTNGLEQDGTSHQDELDSQPKIPANGHSGRLPDTSRHGRKIALDQLVKVRILTPQPHESPLPRRVFASLGCLWRQERNPVATRVHPDLTMLARLSLALARARGVPLAA